PTIAIVQLEDRLAAADGAARFDAHHDADREIDRILDAIAARAERHRRPAHQPGVELHQETIARRRHRLAAVDLPQTRGVVDDARIAALGFDDPAEPVEARARPNRVAHARVRIGPVRGDAAEDQHASGQLDRDVDEIGWTASFQDLETLDDLERIPHGEAER